MIITKIHSREYDEAKNNIAKCLKEIGINYIGILLLHAVDSVLEFRKCNGSWKYL